MLCEESALRSLLLAANALGDSSKNVVGRSALDAIVITDPI
jgi:hypothetical protein